MAAYNWLVLLSFPLSAAAAYLLARYLTLSPAGATVAAMAYAFSPFHLAHAAYHPHIAQTQWVPLYLLALWRCLDDASPAAVGFLGAATLAVTLSNFYGGLIAAVITPVAVAAYWLVDLAGAPAIDAPTGHHRREPRAPRRLRAGLRVVRGPRRRRGPRGLRVPARRPVPLQREMVELSGSAGRDTRCSARRRVASGSAAGVREGLLEQQVSLGWGIVALGLIAIVAVARLRQGGATAPEHAEGAARPPASLARVPVLVVVAVAALVCSLSPERTIGAFTFVRPSALLYDVVPMFRSYARFGVVVQLMAALLAGIGVDHLRRAGTRARADRVRRPRGPRRRRVRRVAVGPVARRAADDGAPLGRAAARSRAGRSTARRSIRSPNPCSG